MNRRLRIIVLFYQTQPDDQIRQTILQHMRVLERTDIPHSIVYYNLYTPLADWLVYFFNPQVIVYHYSAVAVRYLAAPDFARFRDVVRWADTMDVVKVCIPQDEYDRAHLLDQWMDETGIDIVFSCFQGDSLKDLYPITSQKADFYLALTGYVDEAIVADWQNKSRPLNEREYDIVYRARKLPYQYGTLARLKWLVADQVQMAAQKANLTTDISTDPKDTIIANWLDFLASSRTTIGSMSGVSTLDKRGELKEMVDAILAENPDIEFEALSAMLPDGWDSYDFGAVSPRIFEATITGTALVLVEGYYGGVIQPDVHYIPIRRDFSNLEVVMERIEDVNELQRILDNAQRDLIESGEYTYRRFGQRIEAAIGKVIEEKYADNALFSSDNALFSSEQKHWNEFIGFQNRITTALSYWQNGVYLSTRRTIRAIRKRTVRFYHYVNSKRYQATQLFRAQVWDYQETDLYKNLSTRSKKK